MGDCLLWVGFRKIINVAKLFWLLFYFKIRVLFFTKNGFFDILGDFLANPSGHPASRPLFDFFDDTEWCFVTCMAVLPDGIFAFQRNPK
jgi:hypothetical protein